ncbi:Twin-arginine translocation subgoup [Candidatus Magnetobacterium bavaricum]|uniref:Twin-arginine translocation subgoup n=1 Tax=Candidatus Magnetobacterium bavaricum TaxID=29290 RepID=A0A0F3GPS7_9BACT|nr:Twin-arginine translocation subgoup [Candidatus Magnetobacterium bavaricum]
MFDLGMQEIIMIFVVALLVFGPKNLPDLARKVGKVLGQIKRVMFDVRNQVNAAMYAEDNNPLSEELNSLKRELHDIRLKANEPPTTPPEPSKLQEQPQQNGEIKKS